MADHIRIPWWCTLYSRWLPAMWHLLWLIFMSSGLFMLLFPPFFSSLSTSFFKKLRYFSLKTSSFLHQMYVKFMSWCEKWGDYSLWKLMSNFLLFAPFIEKEQSLLTCSDKRSDLQERIFFTLPSLIACLEWAQFNNNLKNCSNFLQFAKWWMMLLFSVGFVLPN